jgi:hypothetical protein
MVAESETPRRGRPRLLDTEHECLLGSLWKAKCRRTVHGRYYMQEAVSLLFDSDESDRHLVPRAPEFAHFLKAGGQPKLTMLAELGRIPDEVFLVRVALTVGRRGLPTSESVALIRRLRIGDGAPDLDRLGDSLIRVIDAHLARYPTTTPHEIIDVLGEIADVLRVAATP